MGEKLKGWADDLAEPNPLEAFETDDVIVILLGAPTENPRLRDRLDGITRLEKLVFLLEKESDLQRILTDHADFESHNFGPFSSKVYQAVETLVSAGLVEETTRDAGSPIDSWEAQELLGTAGDATGFTERQFRLTSLGRRYYEALERELDPQLLRHVGSLKDRFGSLPLTQLIRYVYRKYLEYTDKSLIRKDVLGF